jgi:Zn-dependent alcohol dehydrogenase
LWNAGRLDLEGMISIRSRLADINSAFAELRAGRSIRIVLTG